MFSRLPKFLQDCSEAVTVDDDIQRQKHELNNDLMKEEDIAYISGIYDDAVNITVRHAADSKRIRLKEGTTVALTLENCSDKIKVPIDCVRNTSRNVQIRVTIPQNKLHYFKLGKKVTSLYKYIKYACETMQNAIHKFSSVHASIYSAVVNGTQSRSLQEFSELSARKALASVLSQRLLEKPPNPSQKAAILLALTNRISLIQGPPGTGKTSTVAFLIVAAYKALKPRARILLCGPSNEAADNLALTLAGLEQYKLCRVYASSVLEKKKRAKELELGEKRSAAGCDIVVTTCINAFSKRINSLSFDLVIIDEATQANIPTTLVPIVRSGQHVVLIGDQAQLEPVSSIERSDLRLLRGHRVDLNKINFFLKKSLYVHLLDQKGAVLWSMLNTNYRMHHSIASFPSGEFYKGRLLTAIECDTLHTPPSWPKGALPTIFVDVKGEEERGANTSYSNPEEVCLIVRLVKQYLKDGINPSRIGVIAPYNNQVDLIAEKLKGVEVATVDSYQGREKDIMLISFVRSNEEGDLGFICDGKRLNVTITRAKHAQVLVGNAKCLSCRDTPLKKLIGWYQSRGMIFSPPH